MARPAIKTTANKAKKNVAPPPPKPEQPKGFTCVGCGRTYSTQNGNFYAVRSPLFAKNGGYYPMCRDCIVHLFQQFVEFYNGDEYQAVERICMLTDSYFNRDVYDSAISNNMSGSRISRYLSRLHVLDGPNTPIKTYSDTQLERQRMEIGVTDDEDVAAVNAEQEFQITDDDITRFGYDFTPAEYKTMRALWNKFTDGCGDLTASEEQNLGTMCKTKIFADRAAIAKNTQDYIKLMQLYQNVGSEFDERFKREAKAAQSNGVEPLGVMIRKIEQYTPAEYYKDQALFKDADKMGEYIERFMTRPLRNLMSGEKTMDPEFRVTGDDDNA